VSQPPKTGGRRLKWLGIGLVAALVLWLTAMLVTARPGDPSLYPPRGEAVTIYIIDNGFHTDLALPADRLRASSPVLAAVAETTPRPWVALGWGDASFYTGEGASIERALDGLRALFAPANPSVVRVYGISRDPLNAFAEPVARPIHLSAEGFDRLAGQIEASMTVQGGAPVRADDLPTDPGEAYFRSDEHFSIRRLCNNWTADVLAAGGLPTTPMVDGLAPLLLADLRLRAGVRRPA
jgi:hypothetical protein